MNEITMVEVVEVVESTLNEVQGVILSYQDTSEIDNVNYGAYIQKGHVYGVNDVTNKFFNWSLQLISLLEKIEGGAMVKREKRPQLMAKLQKVKNECIEALYTLEV